MPTTSLPHHLAALWFADIAGYSERAAEDERGALQLIEMLQALSRNFVKSYEGRVVKFLGDAVLAEFSKHRDGRPRSSRIAKSILRNPQRLVVHTICA